MLVNGFRTPDDKTYEHPLAEVDLATGRIAQYPPDVRAYSMIDAHHIVFVNFDGDLRVLDVNSGKVQTLMTGTPIELDVTRFAVDPGGTVWFPLAAYRDVGLAKLDASTGYLTRYSFPYIEDPGVPKPNDCPTGAFHCVPSSAVWLAQVDAIVFDSRNNVWVVTDLAGSHDPNAGDPHEATPMAPVVELSRTKAGS
jgi:hypothetical protein